SCEKPSGTPFPPRYGCDAPDRRNSVTAIAKRRRRGLGTSAKGGGHDLMLFSLVHACRPDGGRGGRLARRPQQWATAQVLGQVQGDVRPWPLIGRLLLCPDQVRVRVAV